MSRRNSSDISSMLSAPDKQIREALGLLSRLYRLILIELNVTPYRWNFLLNRMLEKLSQEDGMTYDRLSNERANLRRGLYDNDMTFPMFCRGLEFFEVEDVSFFVKLEWEENETSMTVKRSVPLFKETPDNPNNLGKLSWLFRSVLAELGKDVNNLEQEIDNYLSNPILRAETSGKRRGNDKGNLRREIPGDNITWDVFKKGVRALMPTCTTIGVTIKWGPRKTTTHRLVIPTPRISE